MLHKNFVLTVLTISAVFFLHRSLSFEVFSLEYTHSGLRTWQFLAIGFISDFWIATCWGVLQFLISLPFHKSLKTSRYIQIGIYLLVLSSAILHQAYIEFFKIPVIPFHLAYLVDTEFITSNLKSSVSWSTIIILIGGIISYNLIKKISLPKSPLLTVFITVTAVFAHKFHIHYKTQWMIPAPLKYNMFENLYSQFIHTPIYASLDPETLQRLVETYGLSSSSHDELTQLETLITTPNRKLTSPLGKTISYEWNKQILEEKKPTLLLLVMESMRSMDMGIISNQSASKSLTPHFDALAKKGVLFRNAWSSGTVTRSAQEALWCGYWSGLNTSLMRTYTRTQLRCLPDSVPYSFWLHGGAGSFDSQWDFWKRHHVTELRDQKWFDPQAPATSWGVTDLALIQKATKFIKNPQKEAPFSLGMILTVSNHIPWDIPSDTPDEVLNFSYPNRHASEKTIRYADHALGQLAKQLKKTRVMEKHTTACRWRSWNFSSFPIYRSPCPLTLDTTWQYRFYYQWRNSRACSTQTSDTKSSQ